MQKLIKSYSNQRFGLRIHFVSQIALQTTAPYLATSSKSNRLPSANKNPYQKLNRTEGLK